jgi:hypothetical protein
LRVGHIQGADAPGCDIVSFENVQDRDRFNSDFGMDFTRVKRFIEVKGRSAEKGTISLNGNELKAAREHGDRYYLYRIYEEVEGKEWQLVELQNPLAYDWPITYDVDPFTLRDTKYWSVTDEILDLDEADENGLL